MCEFEATQGVLTGGRMVDDRLPVAGSTDAIMGGWYHLRRQHRLRLYRTV
jgi:hypothetical protein